MLFFGTRIIGWLYIFNVIIPLVQGILHVQFLLYICTLHYKTHWTDKKINILAKTCRVICITNIFSSLKNIWTNLQSKSFIPVIFWYSRNLFVPAEYKWYVYVTVGNCELFHISYLIFAKKYFIKYMWHAPISSIHCRLWVQNLDCMEKNSKFL